MDWWVFPASFTIQACSYSFLLPHLKWGQPAEKCVWAAGRLRYKICVSVTPWVNALQLICLPKFWAGGSLEAFFEKPFWLNSRWWWIAPVSRNTTAELYLTELAPFMCFSPSAEKEEDGMKGSKVCITGYSAKRIYQMLKLRNCITVLKIMFIF